MLLIVGFICLFIAYWAEKHLMDIKIHRRGFTHSPFTIPILSILYAVFGLSAVGCFIGFILNLIS